MSKKIQNRITILGSKILSASPHEPSCKEDILALTPILNGNAVSCIDVTGTVQIFPTTPSGTASSLRFANNSSFFYNTTTNSNNNNSHGNSNALKVFDTTTTLPPLLQQQLLSNRQDQDHHQQQPPEGTSISGLCQIEAQASLPSSPNASSVLWIGCSNHHGIAVVSFRTENAEEGLPKLGKILKHRVEHFIPAFNESITHMCLVPYMTMAPAVASIGNSGACTIWSIAGRTCLTSVNLKNVIGFHDPFQITAFTAHLSYDQDNQSVEESATSLWVSDSTGHLTCYNAETLEPHHAYNNNYLAKKLSSPITSLVSLPDLNVICAGEESGRILLLKPPQLAHQGENMNNNNNQAAVGASIVFSSSQYPLRYIDVPAHQGSPITCLALTSPDSNVVLSSSSSKHKSSSGTSISFHRCPLIWSCAMNGSVVLLDPRISFGTNSPVGNNSNNNNSFSNNAEQLVIDVSGEGHNTNDVNNDKHRGVGAFITSVCSFASSNKDEILVSGGTSKIVTLQVITIKDQTASTPPAPPLLTIKIPPTNPTLENNNNNHHLDDDFSSSKSSPVGRDQASSTPVNSMTIQQRELVSQQMKKAAGSNNNNNNLSHTATPAVNTSLETKPQSVQQQQNNNNNNANEDKVNILMRRVAELELDLLQAQSVGSELTKRLLDRANKEKEQQQKKELQKEKEKSASPKRINHTNNYSPSSVATTNTIYRSIANVPKSSASTQVDFGPSPPRLNNNNDNDNNNDNAKLQQEFADLSEEYSNRIAALESENAELKERLAESKYVIRENNTNNNATNNDENKGRSGSKSQQEPSSQYRASPSRERGRPMDDYELRCMQRLILENERLRADLHSLRLAPALARMNNNNNTTLVERSNSNTSVTSSSAAVTNGGGTGGEESHNILTVCFLTLRSVLGHHRAAEIVLAVIGDDEEENLSASAAERRHSEVQTIEKLVYELACRIDPARQHKQHQEL